MNGTPVATTGQRGTSQPLLLPTVLPPGSIDPSLVANPSEPDPALRTPLPAPGTAPSATAVQLTGVRLSFDDPTIQQNQDWTVTYEGVIPSSAGVLMDIAPSSPGNFSTLTFTATGANFCGLGIEDWGLGQARANAALSEMAAAKLPVTPEEKTLPSWTTDYVEITDDILVSTDPYWGTDQACWDIPGTDLTNDAGATGGMSVATRRYDLCQATFGQPGSNPDLNVTRDAPILQAYTDHFVVGRFGGFTPARDHQQSLRRSGQREQPDLPQADARAASTTRPGSRYARAASGSRSGNRTSDSCTTWWRRPRTPRAIDAASSPATRSSPSSTRARSTCPGARRRRT